MTGWVLAPGACSCPSPEAIRARALEEAADVAAAQWDAVGRIMAAGWRGNPHMSGDDRNFMYGAARRRIDDQAQEAAAHIAAVIRALIQGEFMRDGQACADVATVAIELKAAVARAEAAEASVERLRLYCSAAARDVAGFAEVVRENADAFPKTLRDLVDTSQFMALAAEGQEEGTIYEDELSKAQARVKALEEAIGWWIDSIDARREFERDNPNNVSGEWEAKISALEAAEDMVRAAITPSRKKTI